MLPSNRPYIIYREHNGAGFWSNFSWVLQALDFADRQGLIPVVDMERYPVHYSESGDEAAAKLGTRNAWEYYFEQPAGLTLAEALNLDPLDNAGAVEDGQFMWSSVTPAPEVMSRGRELVAKYIRFKPEIISEVDKILPAGTSLNVLGVHSRGTDARSGNHMGHPIALPVEFILDQAVQLDSDQGFDHVFLASDELETVSEFRARFGDRLLTAEAHRTSRSRVTAKNYQWLFGAERPLHRYLLGLEVLRDALLLARCGTFLFGLSNVSQCAFYFADPSQVRHILPPQWIMLRSDGVSTARARLADFPPPPKPPSPRALTAQLEEMSRLLELTEIRLAESLAERDELSALAAPQIALQKDHERLLKQHRNLQKELSHARKIITRLQKRVLELVNGWTWLGWRVRPWTKPPWRHDPLMNCVEKGPGPGGPTVTE